jgi:hypothetical protein
VGVGVTGLNWPYAKKMAFQFVAPFFMPRGTNVAVLTMARQRTGARTSVPELG